jgi:hypothetical protein
MIVVEGIRVLPSVLVDVPSQRFRTLAPREVARVASVDHGRINFDQGRPAWADPAPGGAILRDKTAGALIWLARVPSGRRSC